MVACLRAGWAGTPPLCERWGTERDIATGVRTWQGAFIPGLLQTPDYARALAVGNADWDDPDEIERFVEAKIARQARLVDSNSLALWAIVGEGALRQLVGGHEVMRARLARLAEAAAEPNVTVQVVPFLAGSHPGMTSAFSIVSFAEPGAMDVVYMDTTSSTCGWRARRMQPATTAHSAVSPETDSLPAIPSL